MMLAVADLKLCGVCAATDGRVHGSESARLHVMSAACFVGGAAQVMTAPLASGNDLSTMLITV
ncbi:hypothetical protein BJX70DRAFT_378418 [Aspergillus crustosus]